MTLKLVLAFIKDNAKLVIAAILAIALISGAVYTKHWYDDQITQSYNLGVRDTDNKWKIVQQQNKDENQSYKDDQELASHALESKLAEEQAKNAELRSRLDDKQNAYSGSDAGKKQGLDNDFVDIYNESLGVR